MESELKTILIVEDDEGLNELISERIETCGYNVVSAHNATKAMDLLNILNPILVVLDYGLPEMNGKEFITSLKRTNRTVPPFIISTGQGDERIAVEMMKLGARDYITKDVNFLEMIPMVVCRVCSEIENENKLTLVEQAFTELNKFNQQIIESAQEGIVVFNNSNKCQLWNPYMERITGVLSKDIIGNSPNIALPVDEPATLLSLIEKALKGMNISENDFVFLSSTSQDKVWLSISISPLTSSTGQAIGVICTIHDITERKKAEEALAKKVEQLQHMNGFMVDREIRMVGMKKEVNELLVRLGEEKRYN